MRRSLPVLLVTTALLAGACGSSDDAATTTMAATGEPPAVTTNDTTDGTTPETTNPPILPQDCADVPDPSLYPEGQVPAIIPPCEVPDELVVHTIREGRGEPAEDGDTVFVDYLGMIIGSGQVFDTSYTRDIPLDFLLGRGGVIDGWDQGLVDSQVGSLLRLDIPNDLAYGDAPPGDEIQPGDALSFYVEVRAIVPPVTAEDAPLDLDIEPSVGAIGVTTTDLVVGDGPAIELGDTAIVHMLLVRGDNEVVLFNTWERQEPLRIRMEEGQTLPGIFEGLQGATVGSRRVMAMPPALAFGETGEPGLGLPAGTDLIVVADIVGAY